MARKLTKREHETLDQQRADLFAVEMYAVAELLGLISDGHGGWSAEDEARVNVAFDRLYDPRVEPLPAASEKQPK